VSFWFDLEFGGRAAAITDLYLKAEHRRQGFGRKALQFVEAFCRQKGISALELQVEKRNAAARAFYIANGFVAHARIPMSKRLRYSARGLTQPECNRRPLKRLKARGQSNPDRNSPTHARETGLRQGNAHAIPDRSGVPGPTKQ
jgi:ribosomal protein S18 acetylase RimI-like enzyme